MEKVLMDEQGLETWIRVAINLMNEEEPEIARIDSFEDAGILTNNRGLVLKTYNGDVFQMTIVQSK
jgi:hypothetical protein